MTIDEIEDTLLVISEKLNDEQPAINAFTKLYKSYSKFLCSVISRGLKNSGIYDEQILNTVINNTFYKIYDNPLIFSFPENATGDRFFKAWLATVAKNELKRLLEEYYGKSIYLENVNEEPCIESEEISDDIFKSVNLKTMDEALNLLSERDRHVLLTLYMYYDEGKKTPSDVLKTLSEMYNTTNVNIRKIKERSEKKIKDYFTKNTQLKPLKND